MLYLLQTNIYYGKDIMLGTLCEQRYNTQFFSHGRIPSNEKTREKKKKQQQDFCFYNHKHF